MVDFDSECVKINSSIVKAAHKSLNAILSALKTKNVVGGIVCDLHKVLILLIPKYCLLN
jgi:hypothetical protein